MKKSEVSDQVIDHLIIVKEWSLLDSQRRSANRRHRVSSPETEEPRKLMPISVY